MGKRRKYAGVKENPLLPLPCGKRSRGRVRSLFGAADIVTVVDIGEVDFFDARIGF